MFVSYNPAERKAGGGYVLEAGGGVTEGVPPEWEERPHASGQSQYYNIRTKELTWARPATGCDRPSAHGAGYHRGYAIACSPNAGDSRKSAPVKEPKMDGMEAEAKRLLLAMPSGEKAHCNG